MGHYVTMLRYTQQGAAKIWARKARRRLDRAKKVAEEAGGKILALT